MTKTIRNERLKREQAAALDRYAERRGRCGDWRTAARRYREAAEWWQAVGDEQAAKQSREHARYCQTRAREDERVDKRMRDLLLGREERS